MADPNDPIYITAFGELETASRGECELAGIEKLGAGLQKTTCNEANVQVSYLGACWEPDPGVDCPAVGECRELYDCSSEAIWRWGDAVAETGGDDYMSYWFECE